MLETQEIEKFYIELQESINALQISEEEGSTPEQIFTNEVLTLLEEAGETENCRVCYDEKISRRGIEHKINGYALYENYETLDLFITIYHSEESIITVPKNEIDKAISRITKFLENTMQKDYVHQIEESSEVFDLVNTLAHAPEVNEFLSRINIFVLTNGEIKSEVKLKKTMADFKLFFRIIDIQYLFNLSDKSRIPIEINFSELGVPLPCISTNTELEGYQSYLAIIPGITLATIYEQYGLRLLEQNVRSFLQFTGKVNKGIRKTIIDEPHMFLAFNNGIATTAEEIKFVPNQDGNGQAIAFVKDFQIVNGGQTTAAIYHSWKKHKADISEVYVQLKLTTIKNKESFNETVGKIAECANTQNKISASDLSANKESLIELEKISRSTWAPPKDGDSNQTRWFFERARGQYRNERLRQGFTHAKRKAFDLQNPRAQMFTKELFAKFLNSYQEVYKDDRSNKLQIGPHVVVRGSQKNFAQFLSHNINEKPDEIYFQDAIAKAIIFKSAEKAYGVAPNSIGDMRYITVPYSIAWLGFKLNYQIDLYKIWKEQQLDSDFQDILHDVMTEIENFIKNNAPGSLYGEWAKKQDCWGVIKKQEFNINLKKISHYIENKHSKHKPREVNGDTDQKMMKKIREDINSLGTENWKKIYLWCRDSGIITPFLTNVAHNIGIKLREKRNFSSQEICAAHLLLEEIAKKSSLLQTIYEESEK